jgi:hypothetical protein
MKIIQRSNFNIKRNECFFIIKFETPLLLYFFMNENILKKKIKIFFLIEFWINRKF